MPLKKRLFRILAASAILALLAVALLWLGARTAVARRLVGDWIGEATGLPSTVEALRIGFLPGPVLEVDGLAIGQPPGFDADPLLEVGSLRVAVPWGSLFGAPAAHSLSIADATVRPMLGPAGADNWSELFSRLADLGGEGESAWSIGSLDFERGALEFLDATSGAHWRLTAITIAAENIAPAVEFPVELRLAAVADANTIHFALNGRGRVDPDAGRYEATAINFRGWIGGEPLPLAGVEVLGAMELASFDQATRVAKLERCTFNLTGIPGELSGTLTLGEPDLRLAFEVKIDSFAPRAPAIAFGFPLPATADPQAFQSLQFSFEGRMQDGHLHLDPIAGRLDDTQFDGKVVPDQRLIRASVDYIDVNRYFAPGQKKAKDKKATLEAAIEELARFDLDAEIRIAEARVAGAKLRNTVIRVERNAEPAK